MDVIVVAHEDSFLDYFSYRLIVMGIVVVQLWLLMTTINACLGSDIFVVMLAALVSLLI